MELDDILSIGGLATKLFANNRIRGLSRQQQESYLREAALNLQIGKLNSDVAEKTGMLLVQGIQEQTKRTIHTQVNIMRDRGIDLDGSPMLILGETATMGDKKAQEAMFNSMVQQYNYQLSAETAAQHAYSNAGKAYANSMQAMMSNINTVKQGWNIINSISKTSENPIGGLVSGVSEIGNTIDKIFSGLLS